MKDLTIAVPLYNEEEALPILFDTTEKILKEKLPEADYEYLFIDDGSSDGTMAVVHRLAK